MSRTTPNHSSASAWLAKNPMCRRKRSRPSSNRRLTKKVKRLSSGKSVCASAIGVVDEHKLRTNGPASAAGPAGGSASASEDARFAVGVIDSPGQSVSHWQSDTAWCAEGNASGRASTRTWQPRRLRNRPLDRWLCVPVFRRVCPYHRRKCRSGASLSQGRKCGAFLKWYLYMRFRDATYGRVPAYVARDAGYVM